MAETAPETARRDFEPNGVRPEALNLSQVMAAQRQKSAATAKNEALILTAEVTIPGLPNGVNPETGEITYGLVCQVKRFTGFEKGQIVFKSREGAQPDDKERFKVPDELSSPSARSNWWRDIWRLIYGCTDDTKRVLAALATGKSDARPQDFNIDAAIYWMNAPESDLVADPLLEAITILNDYSKTPVRQTSELDDFKMFPEVFEAAIVAYRNGELSQFLTGNAEYVQFALDTVRMFTDIQNEVTQRDAATYARASYEAIKQAIREILSEWFEGKTWPLDPTFRALLTPPNSFEAQAATQGEPVGDAAERYNRETYQGTGTRPQEEEQESTNPLEEAARREVQLSGG